MSNRKTLNETKRNHQHQRCECSPNCPDCIYCDAKFELIVIGGEVGWVVVPTTIQ